MEINDRLPETEQGMIDYIRFAENHIKRTERKNKGLIKNMNICRDKLRILGWDFINNQWEKHNAKHLQTV